MERSDRELIKKYSQQSLLSLSRKIFSKPFGRLPKSVQLELQDITAGFKFANAEIKQLRRRLKKLEKLLEISKNSHRITLEYEILVQREKKAKRKIMKKRAEARKKRVKQTRRRQQLDTSNEDEHEQLETSEDSQEMDNSDEEQKDNILVDELDMVNRANEYLSPSSSAPESSSISSESSDDDVGQVPDYTPVQEGPVAEENQNQNVSDSDIIIISSSSSEDNGTTQ